MKKLKDRIILPILIMSFLLCAVIPYNLFSYRYLRVYILIVVIVLNALAVMTSIIWYRNIQNKVALLKDDEDIYKHLIKRAKLHISEEKIKSKLKGKVCLVTGGGGTIGSELCMQIAKYSPKMLIILDIYENNVHALQQKLLREYPQLNFCIQIASIRDYGKMNQLLDKYKTDVIFHAAAHKHVPLMEDSPDEAIKNNIGGTLNVAKLAKKYNVDELILISTDKAVKPTSVMGATKYCCEIIMNEYASHKSSTKFRAVRFGNVIGSSGSVIPLFKEQILSGGPLTLTDPDVERYFMTITEAVLLVLQSTIYDEGTFVLDMGEPIRIADIATDMISLFGYKPNKDINIEYIGLRAGEKLHEEYIGKNEDLAATGHERIYKVEVGKICYDELMAEITKLIQLAEEGIPPSELKAKLHEIINI